MRERELAPLRLLSTRLQQFSNTWHDLHALHARRGSSEALRARLQHCLNLLEDQQRCRARAQRQRAQPQRRLPGRGLGLWRPQHASAPGTQVL